MKYVVIIICLFSGIFFLRNFDIKDLTAHNEWQISSNIYIHQSSSKVYTITDESGMGLIYGSLDSLVWNKDKTLLFMSYKDYSEGKAKFATLNLNNKKVLISDNLLCDFKDVDVFLKNL
jgi:hypothetical protein